MNANCTSHSGAQSTVAPASTRICAPCPGTGIGAAIAGREMPRIRPMRRSAAAIVAPVLPAPTMASALPSFTSCAHCTTEASFLRRTTVAGSCISTTSAGRDELDVARVGREQRLHRVGPADEQHADTELVGGLDGAGHDLRRARGRRPWRRRRWSRSSRLVDSAPASRASAHASAASHRRPTRRRSPDVLRTSRSCCTRCAAA